MKERPILFSAPMVRALLAGTKTQTRRVVKPQPTGFLGGPGVTMGDGTPAPRVPVDDCAGEFGRVIRCPYGQPGDRIYVREAFRLLDVFDANSPGYVGKLCLIADYPKPWAPIHYEADGSRDNWMHVGTPPHDSAPPTPGKLRPGIHMPRWTSRILLEIVGVRVERLQEISEADSIAEGVDWHTCPTYQTQESMSAQHHANSLGMAAPYVANIDYIAGYRKLWEQINGLGSWDANPFVWVVAFKRVLP